MTIRIPATLLQEIHTHGEKAYPEEGAGFLLGSVDGGFKVISSIMPLNNSREEAARHNRYLLTAEDYLRGELEAERLGVDVLGVFHSHPDHPNLPSEFDRDWAMPWFSYIITSVQSGCAIESLSWVLAEDRSGFLGEDIDVQQ